MQIVESIVIPQTSTHNKCYRMGTTIKSNEIVYDILNRERPGHGFRGTPLPNAFATFGTNFVL